MNVRFSQTFTNKPRTDVPRGWPEETHVCSLNKLSQIILEIFLLQNIIVITITEIQKLFDESSMLINKTLYLIDYSIADMTFTAMH